jgi:alginate O-acetyltransferase complex protein AlgF
MRFSQRLILIFLLFFGSVTAQFLYDPEPPANSAFVRVVNLINSGQKIEIGNLSFDTVQTFSVTPYRVIPQGKQMLAFMGKKTEVSFLAQKFYTIVARAGNPIVLEDMASSKTKALISLYNLSLLEAVSLKTDDNKVIVIADTKPNTVKSQSVNAIKIGFLVAQNSKKLVGFPAVQLERGMSYSAFVFSLTKAIWITNSTQK